MAAYAALCSLMHIIHRIQNHPRPPILIHKTQVESLTENVTFLQEFLEGYSNAAGYTKEADPLESRIADAAHAAEDVIESHIVDRIHAGSTRPHPKFHLSKSSRGPSLQQNHQLYKSLQKNPQLYQSLQKVIEEMDAIKKDVMEIVDKAGVRDQLQRNSITNADLSRPSSMWQSTMVGFDEALLEILDKLTGGQPDRQVIPIVGVGGMGKTTLARNVYVNPLIQQHFDVCAWATISQEYDAREILREVLSPGKKEWMRNTRVDELGNNLHKHLSGRRYLIVLDDMWSSEAWDEVTRFFPDYKNGSRIIITTRLLNLTSQLIGSYYMEMELLDEHKSWNLLCKTVFREEGCPLELEKIGKKIAENCSGLPLSIVVTGGLMVKFKHSLKYWEYIAENLNSLVNSEDSERCLNILYMSYKQMPVYLKPCFLYMGIFSEDSVIQATMLTRLWVAEGFLKPVSGKSLEETAEECLEELIDRNLVCATQRRVGKIKECSIHDLLRDLCFREAQKEKFYYVTKKHSLNDSKGVNSQRRIVIPRRKLGKEVVAESQSMSVVRSLICKDGLVPRSLDFRLLRILNAFEKYINPPVPLFFLENMFHLVNSRYLVIRVRPPSKFPSSICLLWNLHTLKVDCGRMYTVYSCTFLTAPTEIWSMHQLRHLKFVDGLYLPDPPRREDDIVLANLQSLSRIVDFKCSEEVIKRIPNLKKLRISYDNVEGSSHYCIDNLDRLHKLESLKCDSLPFVEPNGTDFLLKLSFPQSLKKLTLDSNHAYWDDIIGKIGSLPLLEVLKLKGGAFHGGVWETVEGQFSSLKLLMIVRVYILEYWNSESTHFPCLEQLVLDDLPWLEEIPSGIGEIPTLHSVMLAHCSYYAAISAKKILEEQEKSGDVTLQVRVSW